MLNPIARVLWGTIGVLLVNSASGGYGSMSGSYGSSGGYNSGSSYGSSGGYGSNDAHGSSGGYVYGSDDHGSSGGHVYGRFVRFTSKKIRLVSKMSVKIQIFEIMFLRTYFQRKFLSPFVFREFCQTYKFVNLIL